jgi:hypothetical protein
VAATDQTWIARLTPLPGSSLARLLALPLGLDVWERHPGHLVVAAPESRLAELERRRLATVDRLTTTERYEEEMADRAPGDDG